MSGVKIEPKQVYIVNALDFPGEIDEFTECPGNDVLVWEDLKYMDENEFTKWIKSQLPEDVTKYLLEWYW